MYDEESAKAMSTAAPEDTSAMTITAAGGRPIFWGFCFCFSLFLGLVLVGW